MRSPRYKDSIFLTQEIASLFQVRPVLRDMPNLLNQCSNRKIKSGVAVSSQALQGQIGGGGQVSAAPRYQWACQISVEVARELARAGDMPRQSSPLGVLEVEQNQLRHWEFLQFTTLKFVGGGRVVPVDMSSTSTQSVLPTLLFPGVVNEREPELGRALPMLV